ncbi:MAG: acyl-CoA/acyl-ACP dehydrogenase [Frankia sp.]|nr:acyl-CoA/acyl-ACP dehydrogenase [Frankia sp.]
MLLELSPDQEMLRQTTARFLADHVPSDVLRRLRADDAGFDRGYWAEGAGLGWTSLLVDERHGGGSVSGTGLVDLTVIAHEFGAAAAPGPLVVTNVVAAALSAAASADSAAAHEEVLAGLLSGETIAAWCPPPAAGGTGEIVGTADGDDIVLTGVARPVEAAGQADCFLLTARLPEGRTQLLVPAGTPGVSVEPLRSVDLTRRLGLVRLDAARLPRAAAVVGEPGTADETDEWLRQLALVIVCAETTGAMQAAFDLTVRWAFERYSFGRPLASYQALKHRFADMKSWLEATHALADAAAAAVAAGTPDAAELASAAKAFSGDYGGELAQDCVQMHGGIGVTFEHDLHLYLRRITLDRALYGTPADHRLRVADAFEHSKERA